MDGYSRATLAELIGSGPMDIYRWLSERSLHASVRDGAPGGIGFVFDRHDARLAAMLANTRGERGDRTRRKFRRALSEAWYGSGSCPFIVVTDGQTVTRCDSVEHAVSVAGAARGEATILWPDRLLGWA